MSHIITELKNLSFSEISNNDFIIVTDITNSLNQIETKTITLNEFIKYNITESNVLNTFRSGSHSGIFTGNLSGLAVSSSISTTSSISNTSNYLNYSINNGTASYSINSNNTPKSSNSSYALTSSYALNSTTSSKAAYVNVNEVTYKAATSDYSPNSTTSSLSQKTNYLNFNGSDNGIIYHAINSDTCSYSSTAKELNPINTTTAYKSITSSYASTSVTSSYGLSSSYTDFSIKSILSNSEAHAYVTLLINGTAKQLNDAIKNNTISSVVTIQEYFNINKVMISPGYNKSIDIIVQYETELKDEKSALIKVNSSSRIQYSNPNAYIDNTDLIEYSSNMYFNTDSDSGRNDNIDQIPWDMTVGKSCSKSTAKITLIAKRFNGHEVSDFIFGTAGTYVEQREVLSSLVFNKAYITLLVLDGNVINGGINYPEMPPTTIPPKC